MGKRITNIGGQALMEGIMMVGPNRTAAAFCDPQGNISTEDITFDSMLKKHAFMRLPFLRGTFAMVDSMRRGYQALSLSAEKYLGEDEEELTGIDKWLNDHFGDKVTAAIMTVASVLGVGLAILLFFMLPTVLFNLASGAAGGAIEPLRSLFEGVFRMLIFLGYLAVMTLIPDIKRTFMYHGAEHKTIFCYENEEPLTVENVQKQSRFHPRCGTSFLVLMLVISIIVGFFIPFTNPLLRTLVKILLIPVVMNIGYEALRLCGKHNNVFTRTIAAPGLWVQRLTTKEPDDNMIRAAISAMEAVVPENGEDLVQ